MVKRIPAKVRRNAKPALDTILELVTQVPKAHRAAYLKGVIQLARTHATPYIGSEIPQQRPTQVGEAYWIFNSSDDPRKIREVLAGPRIREGANVSSELKLTLLEGYDSVPNDANLRERAELQLDNIERDGPLYTLRGRLSGATNRQTFSELGKILRLISGNQERAETEGVDLLDLFRIGGGGDLYLKFMGKYFDGSEEGNYLPEED